MPPKALNHPVPGKARPHVSQSEGLIFEKSSPGKHAYSLPRLDVPAVKPEEVLGAEFVRREIEDFPEVSEIEIIRHFTRLSSWNYGVDTGMYPLGSCTMKYNPRINEVVARLEGLASEHPYQGVEYAQGCLKILRQLERCLLEITGMDAITLQPAA
ncbi:MAG: aminomethyl-transferring glycine dehydrogenase subunit GcvPB, partial [Terriglobia bacterium]